MKNNTTNLRDKMFFCYSKYLKNFLENEKHIISVMSANHLKTGKRFWVFEYNEELKSSLTEYGEQKN
ncbi:hypothetical protein [Lactococcus garvieae]|uniref:hypothetical protein n=1 Tax=Lactococcus garvieae TaxID=1363 RepID=UPI0018D754C9|nr:hypothetical protein [Lactococcus garvieae]QPS71408.1 hypothetical protein I6G50_01735 [Lactococcus garvieae]